MSEFSHIEDDRAQMVDIGDKPAVDREATALGTIRLSPSTAEAIAAGDIEKGAVLSVARVAGIQAAKRTAETVPMCHQVPISGVTVDFGLNEAAITAKATVSTTARTGVEMEAINAVTGALICIWDMVKSAEKDDDGQYPTMAIDDIHVVEKRKGESA